MPIVSMIFVSSPISDPRRDPEGARLGFEAHGLDPRMKTHDASELMV